MVLGKIDFMFNKIQGKVFQGLSELAYQVELLKHRSNLPKLFPTELQIVDALKNEGVFVTSLDALSLPYTSLLLKAVESLLPNIETVFSSDLVGYFRFDSHTVHVNYPQMARNYPDIFLWGLQERILNIVENYIGLPVAFLGTDLRKDIAKGKDVGSRRWHKDGEDRRVIRIIIYLNDVFDDGVAFEYIPKHLNLSNLTKNLYLDEEIRKIVPTSYLKPCLGSAGTVVFAATSSIFHHGKVFVEPGTDRLALFFAYTSRQPKRPEICKPHFSKEGMNLLEGKLSKRQRECVFWY
jgi:hypothetical protein